ncbi:hypothetical protein [Ureibacillus manganicus]|uniref:Uncharacterized protein n=1 Tax=Ureibacillus manganicus DSM 26584 TaxID=1384049 RepID=A0A0A3I5N0_9BACL|nr:hypothetical protein [Ureibacillus manganicus]KGR78003.1 hypothetical protein CD29_12650 [Ureibacillus manganicus DSM 26584]
MEQFASFGTMGIWIGIFSSLMFVLCLYFFLTYFEHLKHDEDEQMNKSKSLAVLTLALGLLVPAFYQMFLFNQMMN